MRRTPAARAEAFVAGEIKDVVVRDLRRFKDDRGWLSELVRHDELDPEFFSGDDLHVFDTGVPTSIAIRPTSIIIPKGVAHAY